VVRKPPSSKPLASAAAESKRPEGL
jgi:hypothetical protein